MEPFTIIGFGFSEINNGLLNISPFDNVNKVYKMINNMDYQDYSNKYLTTSLLTPGYKNCFSLLDIATYLCTHNNYKIYESMNDYLSNTDQIKQIKLLTGNKTVLIDNGAHLGFLYRKEFIESLKETITALKNNQQL